MGDYQGQCLCGDVKFTIQIDKKELNKCHCEMCRQWACGSTAMVHGEHMPKLEDESTLGVYNSSDWGQRCFCKNCGTSLFWKHRQMPFCGVSINCLNDADDFVLTSEIFVDEIPKSHQANEQTHLMTKQQFWEMIEQMTS